MDDSRTCRCQASSQGVGLSGEHCASQHGMLETASEFLRDIEKNSHQSKPFMLQGFCTPGREQTWGRGVGKSMNNKIRAPPAKE